MPSPLTIGLNQSGFVEVTVAQTGNRSGGRRDHSGLLVPLGALPGLPYHTEHRPSDARPPPGRGSYESHSSAIMPFLPAQCGMPVLDLNSSTVGYVRQVVRTSAGEIEFVVDYSRWWGWFGRPVAVPLEALGIEGGHLVSLDMPPSEYAAAPTWHDTGAAPLPADATVRVALSRS